MFKLQEITAMKLQHIVLINNELDFAKAKNWPQHIAACEAELSQAKYEAMHPVVILDFLTAVLEREYEAIEPHQTPSRRKRR